MTTAPWVYIDPDSKSTLMVCPGSEPGLVTVEAHDPRDNAIVRVPLPAGSGPGLPAAAAAAAGTANPVVLPRRDVPKRGAVATAVGDVSVGADGLLHVTGGPGQDGMSPEDARVAAAALASAADVAAAEPDPSVSAALAAAHTPGAHRRGTRPAGRFGRGRSGGGGPGRAPRRLCPADVDAAVPSSACPPGQQVMTAPRTPRPGSARKPLRDRDTGPGPALRLVTGCAGQLPGAGTGPRRDQPGAAGLVTPTAAGQAAATAGPGTLTPLAWLQVEQAREALRDPCRQGPRRRPGHGHAPGRRDQQAHPVPPRPHRRADSLLGLAAPSTSTDRQRPPPRKII